MKFALALFALLTVLSPTAALAECSDCDGDGFNEACTGFWCCDPAPLGACVPGSATYDCNDFDASVHPGAAEICGNPVDENCDGALCGFDGCYDGDGDGFSACYFAPENCPAACAPGGLSYDCDDTTASTHPGAPDFCEDGIDNDCDGANCHGCGTQDLDGDGWRKCSLAESIQGVCDGCAVDCNDFDATIHPGASEFCGNFLDDDCNGLVDDEDLASCAPGPCLDFDDDGYGAPASSSCLFGMQDCDDMDAAVHPNLPEICGNGADDNCNGIADAAECSGLGQLLVTKTEDSADGACDADCSLREAIMAANETPGTDRIIVPAGLYRLTIPPSSLSAANGDLEVFDDLWIEGDGMDVTVVDGDGLDRVFGLLARPNPSSTAFRNNALAIRSLTIRGGRVLGGGGGLYNAGARLDLADVAIRDNVAMGDNSGPFGWGGGLYNSGLTSIRVCEITGNESSLEPGSSFLWAKGGGVANVLFSGEGGSPYLVIRETLLEGNAADETAGGALFDDGLAPAQILDSALRNNHASEGGAIATDGGLRLVRSTLTGNTAVAAAGFLASDPVSVDGLPGANAVLIAESVISDNEATAFAGGLALTNANAANALDEVTVSNTTISGNRSGIHATNGSGSEVWVRARNSASEARLSLRNVTISQADESTPGVVSVFVTGQTGRPATLEAANTIVDGSCEKNGAATIASLGHNLESGASCGFAAAGDLQNTDPKLGALADNGGGTETHALLAGSPAIDAGDPAFCPATDQRGEPRDAACDIGAYEYAHCPDADGDGYSPEGGACGPADCDDADASVHPGAAENPGTPADDNCNGNALCGALPPGGGGLLALAPYLLGFAALARRRR